LIEQAMIFALGFFVAGLLALLFLPAVQRRAARLAARRMEMQLPLSMEEIVAERDQLRAEFAVERRRLEQRLEAEGETAAGHMADVGRHTATINDLNGQLSDTREDLRTLGEAKDALNREMAEVEARISPTLKALDEETAAHNITRENLRSKTSEAEVLLVERDLARTERDGLETKRATLQRRLDEEALRAADLRDQIETLRQRVAEADRARFTGQQTRDVAEQRHAEAERQLQEHENRIRALQSAAAERHATQVAEIATLTGQLETARREHASLREERRARDSAGAQKLEAEIARAHQAEADWKGRHAKQAEEIAALAAALEDARRENAAASGGIAPVDPTKAGLPDVRGQREETALLRQAIADLGSEVVRIAGSLKEPGKPEDGDSVQSDVIDVRQRSRARAQS